MNHLPRFKIHQRWNIHLFVPDFLNYLPLFQTPFGSKLNEFERKKIGKKRKNSKNLKVAGNYPNI